MNYKFISAGSMADYKKKELYLDVGNKLQKGIIDHHQLNIQKSATTLTYENPNFILKDTKTIILHKSVDLDCIASSYLAEFYLQNEKFPDFAEELCRFVDVIDFGKRPKSFINLNSFFILRKTNNDYENVKIGHYLIEKLSFFGFEGGKYPTEFKEDIKNIENNYKIFKDDLKKSKKIECILSTKNNKKQKIKGLILFAPKSMFFKYFARDIGYELLIVKWSDKRVVISLKNDSLYTLKGIGDMLNEAEKKKREKLGIKLNESNRIGYDMPDPWYDGRGHNYTIIDSPKIGTLLDFEKILQIVCR